MAVLPLVLASLMLAEGYRLDVKKVSAIKKDSAAGASKEQTKAEVKGNEWWDKLVPDCESCVKAQMRPAYYACKADCKSRSYRDQAYYTCKKACKGVARTQSLSDFRDACSSRCVVDFRALAPEKPSPSKPDTSSSSIIPDVRGLTVGHRNAALIPALVPKAGMTYEVMNHEDASRKHGYAWNFVSVKTRGSNRKEHAGGKNDGLEFAMVDGGFSGGTFNPLIVKNTEGKDMFLIQNCKAWSKMKALIGSEDFCITDKVDRILFTVSKDKVGRGWMFKKDEWRIYRGEKKHDHQLYYCVKSQIGKDHVFYKSEKDFENNAKEVAHSERMYESGTGASGPANQYSLSVEAGEDTALLLAATVTIDMVYDNKKK